MTLALQIVGGEVERKKSNGALNPVKRCFWENPLRRFYNKRKKRAEYKKGIIIIIKKVKYIFID